MGSPWHAGKHLEACATMSAQLLPEAAARGGAAPSSSSLAAAAAAAAADFARRAAALYAEGGRAGAGAEALGRAAKLLEARGALKAAAALCDEALDMAEADGGAGGGQAAADLFRQAAALALARGRWAEAASLLLRFGEACDRSGARASQARAYLGAVVALLHAGDAGAAWATFQDVLPVGGGAFASSEEAGAARALFDAYRGGAGAGTAGGGEEAVRAAVGRCGPTLRNLDAPAARLAVKLPSAGSDLRAMAAALGGAAGEGGGAGDEEAEEEDLT